MTWLMGYDHGTSMKDQNPTNEGPITPMNVQEPTSKGPKGQDKNQVLL